MCCARVGQFSIETLSAFVFVSNKCASNVVISDEKSKTMAIVVLDEYMCILVVLVFFSYPSTIFSS